MSYFVNKFFNTIKLIKKVIFFLNYFNTPADKNYL